MAFNVNPPDIGNLAPLFQHQTGAGDYVKAGLEGYQNAMTMKDELRKRKFMETLTGELQSGTHDYQTPEGQSSLVKALAVKGFGPEAMDLAAKFPKQEKQSPQYDFINQGDGAVFRGNKVSGEGVSVAPRDPTKSNAEAAKEKFNQDIETKKLKQSSLNLAKDNEIAAAKLELARQNAEIQKRKEEQAFEKKSGDKATTIAKADESVALIDQMIGNEALKIPRHPGLSTAVGAKGASYLFGLKEKPIAGTDAANFQALLDQVKGGAFLEAVTNMKGSGALSEMEGSKAQAAIARMQQSQTEEAFIKAAKEYRDVITNRKGRAIEKFDRRDGSIPATSKPKADPLGLF